MGDVVTITLRSVVVVFGAIPSSTTGLLAFTVDRLGASISVEFPARRASTPHSAGSAGVNRDSMTPPSPLNAHGRSTDWVGIGFGERDEEVGEACGGAGVPAGAGDHRRVGSVQDPVPGAFQCGDQSDVLVGGQRGKPVDGEVGAGGHTQVGPMHVGMPDDALMKTLEPLSGAVGVFAPVRHADHAGHGVGAAVGVGQLV